MKTKNEKRFDKLKKKFDSGMMTREELSHIPTNKKEEYIARELEIKYKKKINYTCLYCAETCLFEDSGYVTDEELLEQLHMFKPK